MIGLGGVRLARMGLRMLSATATIENYDERQQRFNRKDDVVLETGLSPF